MRLQLDRSKIRLFNVRSFSKSSNIEPRRLFPQPFPRPPDAIPRSPADGPRACDGRGGARPRRGPQDAPEAPEQRTRGRELGFELGAALLGGLGGRALRLDARFLAREPRRSERRVRGRALASRLRRGFGGALRDALGLCGNQNFTALSC